MRSTIVSLIPHATVANHIPVNGLDCLLLAHLALFLGLASRSDLPAVGVGGVAALGAADGRFGVVAHVCKDEVEW